VGAALEGVEGKTLGYELPAPALEAAIRAVSLVQFPAADGTVEDALQGVMSGVFHKNLYYIK
jgi:hypothetical protein